MGFWSWLFGKKKKEKYEIEDSDGQEQYFKDDFDESKKSAPKTKKAEPKAKVEKTVAAEEKSEAKAAPKKTSAPIEEKPVAKVTSNKEESVARATANEDKPEKKEAPASLPESDSKARRTGRFEIKKSKDGRFVFNLYAPNHIIVATSQVYSSSSAAINGIQSIIANAERAPLEDNTLKNPTTQSYPKWEMYIDKGGQYRFRLYATNGNCVVHSQGYTAKASCKNGIDSIIRCAKNAEIDKSYLKNSKL